MIGLELLLFTVVENMLLIHNHCLCHRSHEHLHVLVGVFWPAPYPAGPEHTLPGWELRWHQCFPPQQLGATPSALPATDTQTHRRFRTPSRKQPFFLLAPYINNNWQSSHSHEEFETETLSSCWNRSRWDAAAMSMKQHIWTHFWC